MSLIAKGHLGLLSQIPLWLIAALFSILLAASGQIMLKVGVKSLRLPDDALAHPVQLVSALLSPIIIVGIALFACSVIFWLAAISGQELSRVYPLASLGYVIVTIASIKLFGDEISLPKIAGICLIILGVSILQMRLPTKAISAPMNEHGTPSISAKP